MSKNNARTAMFSRRQAGGMFTIEDQSLTTGARFFVHSSGSSSTSAGKNPDNPITTTLGAIGLTTENVGDIIYLMPGHTETLATAAVLPIATAGIKIVGLGWGATKPTFTITTGQVESPILISAASVEFGENIRIVGGKAGGSDQTISITASNVVLGSLNPDRSFDFISTATTELGIGAGDGVITVDDSSGALSGIKFLGLTYRGGAGDDESFISVNDGTNGAADCVIDGCNIRGTFADNTIQLDQGTNVNTLWDIQNSTLMNLGGDNIAITLDATTVHFLTNLYVNGAGTTTKPIVGANASYANGVWTCESGAAGGTALNQTVTNWGA